MDFLDQHFTDERIKADDADLYRRAFGRTPEEEQRDLALKHEEAGPPIDYAARKAQREADEAEQLRKFSFGEVPAIKKAKKALAPVVEVLADPRTEALGSGITTGGVVTGQPELIIPGMAMLGMAKAGKLLRKRFNIEEIVDQALNPSSLAERVTAEINKTTAVLDDATAAAQADALVKSGGVTRETLTNYAPGTALLSPSQALAAQKTITNESKPTIDAMQHASKLDNPQMATQALAQLLRLNDPFARYTGAVTTTGQTLRLSSSPDIQAIGLMMERASKTTAGMTDLEKVKYIVADPLTDPALVRLGTTHSFDNIISQAHEIAATENQDAATVFLHAIEDAVAEEEQLGLFVTKKEVKAAQKEIKNVTAQHIVEANQGAARKAEEAFTLTPTGPTPYVPKQTTFLLKPIKPGDQITDDQVREFNTRLAKSQEESFNLTSEAAPGGTPIQQPLFPKPIKPGDQITDDQIREYNRLVAESEEERLTLTAPPGGAVNRVLSQEDFVKEAEKQALITLREHQAQDLRAAAGESAFDPRRTPFKLTPPPGGARRPAIPKQLDLLNLIAKEPDVEQLALEMATTIDHPNTSKEFLKMIRSVQDAVTFGGDPEKVGEALKAIQEKLAPKARALAAEGQPTRLVAHEKEAFRNALGKLAGKNLTDLEIVKALSVDPMLQPDALIRILNNLKKPGWRDGVQHLVINAMLTPSSVAVNFMSTALMLPLHLGARAIAGQYGRAVASTGRDAGVVVGEAAAMMHGLQASFWDSVDLAKRVTVSGKAEIGRQAIRERAIEQHPFTADNLFEQSAFRKMAGIPEAASYDSASYPVLSRAGAVSRGINFFGVAVGLPGRLMLTGDQFIQIMAMNAEINAQVFRAAAKRAMKLEEYDAKAFRKQYFDEMKTMRDNLDPAIRKAGETFSLEVSFNSQAGPLGQQILALREMANAYTGIGGTVALPFYNTIANAVKATWEFSPLGPTSQMAAHLMKRGASESGALKQVATAFRDDMFGRDPVKRDLAVGKWAVGMIVISTLLMAAQNGRLTGRGPDSKELQQERRDAYGLPNSFVYNMDSGERIQVKRLGLLGNLAGLVADASEAWMLADGPTQENIAHLLITAYVSNMGAGFMENSTDVVQALVNGVKKKEDLDALFKVVPAFIPLSGTMKAAGRIAEDEPPAMKDARISLDKILAKLPGYDSIAKEYGMPRVPPLRNQFGDAVLQPKSGYGTTFFNPLFTSGPSQDTTLQRISELEVALDIRIEQPANMIGKSGVPLTPDEYERYQQFAGAFWRQRAEQLLPALENPMLPDQVKRDLIAIHLEDSRRTGLMKLESEARDLVQAIAEDKAQRYTTPHMGRKAVRSPQGVANGPHINE